MAQQPVIQMSDAEMQKLRDAQARADTAYLSHGTQAPPPMHGETSSEYRRRLLAPLQKHSSDIGAVNLSMCPPDILPIVEAKVYADSVAAARSPKGVVPGTLREIQSRDASGRQINEFFGHPDACWAPFKMESRRARIRDPRIGRTA